MKGYILQSKIENEIRYAQLNGLQIIIWVHHLASATIFGKSYAKTIIRNARRPIIRVKVYNPDVIENGPIAALFPKQVPNHCLCEGDKCYCAKKEVKPKRVAMMSVPKR